MGGSGSNTLGIYDASGGATVTKQATSDLDGTLAVNYAGGSTSDITWNQVQQIVSNVTFQ